MPTTMLLPTPSELLEMIQARQDELRRLRAMLRLSARANAIQDLVEQHQAEPSNPPAPAVAGK